MRMSRFMLTLRYANRCPFFGAAAIGFIVAFMFMPWFLPTVVRDLRLTLWGDVVQGEVVGKFRAAAPSNDIAHAALFAHGGKRTSYRVTFSYAVNGRQYHGETTVSSAAWDTAQPGQPIDVVFLPSDPSIYRVGFPIWRTGAIAVVLIGSVALAFGVRFLLAGIRDIGRKVRLIEEGEVALGVIDAVEIAKGRRGGEIVRRMRYRYAVGPQGSEQLFNVDLDGIFQTWSYLPGDIREGEIVLVAYDPQNPERHEIDRFDARRGDRLRLLAQDVSPRK